MTNVRITYAGAHEWLFCPYCGQRVELDQDPDAIIRDAGGINPELSEAAGFNFDHSLSHCGYHIRLWMPQGDDFGDEIA